MLAYTVRRILVSVPVLIVSTFVVFLVVVNSGDPVANFATSRQPAPSKAAVAAFARHIHADQPVVERYWNWITGVLHGDFGPSVQSNLDIGHDLFTRFRVTVTLVAAAMIIALLLAVLFGVFSAIRQYSVADYVITFVGFLFLAMPVFWFAVLLKQAGIRFNESTGSQFLGTIGEKSPYLDVDTAWNEFTDRIGHLVLPTITLALVSFASWTRYTRASMLEVLSSDYVRLARAKGLRRGKVMTRHALRTALIPLTTVTALDIAIILGGAVVTETIFQWHGMGEMLVQAATTVDVYRTMAWLLLSAVVVIGFNLVADLLYAVLDPRIRYD
ncbi:ABC transporter permease [Streptomyces hygroscopicus]|uniref:ABC transporter permease n=1 Tax=Streptomyces hygroscopicus TaxID=1912 RepID=UPI00223E8FD6|nr:ABC transporter permease [Streptomyces hygroscopicus]MCW7941580.1 ABC transporter permease [Streptomyces hygroscopicus]